jgi:hypothetical protein
MSRSLRSLLVVGALAALACPQATAATSIPPAALALQPSEVPGFAGAKATQRVRSTAAGFAEAALEAGSGATLRREGFEKGLVEVFGNQKGGVAAVAGVFHTATGARQLFRIERAQNQRESRHAGRFTVAAIPGSLGFTEAQPAGSGITSTSAAIQFASGRCFFEIAVNFNGVEAHSGLPEVMSAASAGAASVYERTRALCTGA